MHRNRSQVAIKTIPYLGCRLSMVWVVLRLPTLGTLTLTRTRLVFYSIVALVVPWLPLVALTAILRLKWWVMTLVSALCLSVLLLVTNR